MSSGIVNVTPGRALDAPFEDDERWKTALRVAASREFSKSARLRNFLLYVCEKALSGRAGEIREQLIGAEVFNRKPDYNPGEDNIVRVEARELRKRLDRYFTGEGAREPFRIKIPKGSYVPAFEPFTEKTGLVAKSSAVLQPTVEAAAEPAGRPAMSGSWRPIPGSRLSWSAIGLIAVVALLALTQTRKLGDFAKGFTKGSAASAQGGFWSTLFQNQRPVTIVTADSSLVLVQDITHQVVPLNSYANKSYFDLLKGPAVSLIMQRPYTSLADAVVCSELLQTAGPRHPSLQVRYARDLNMRDLENGNLVFLGSSYSDPWISEFRAQRNFVIEVDAARRQLYFLNKSPKTGEADRYYAYYAPAQNSPTDETYGLISYLPNLRRTGKVLILEGTNSEGTEAAGDFITSPGAASALREQLHLGAKPVPSFQLLIKTATVDHTPTKLQIVAARVLPAIS